MSAINLLRDRWIPVLRAGPDGKGLRPDTISPAEITSLHDTEPVMAVDWPRADHRIGQIELWIAIFALTFPPRNRREWRRLWKAPPSPEELREAFAPYAHAFELDGTGPRFMQDQEPLDGAESGVSGLLIEAPGANTVKRNLDMFEKRGRIDHLSRPAAAIVLFSMQTYAPAGGAGHRTSLRGGGPLTTLVIPPTRDGRDRPTLFEIVWANVPHYEEPLDPADLPLVCPWMRPTLISDRGSTVVENSEGTDPRLAFFGMPRRVRLRFREAGPDERCDLTGAADSVLVSGYVTRPWGENYVGWSHPLSPYYKAKEGELPIHPGTEPIGYRDWAGLIYRRSFGSGAKPGARRCAHVVDLASARLSPENDGPLAGLLCAGFAMDNMKALAFIESEVPFFLVPETEGERPADAAERLVGAADIVVRLLVRCVRDALYGSDPDFDASPFEPLRERFWTETETAFRAVFEASLRGEEQTALSRRWLRSLAAKARELFDEAVTDDVVEAFPARSTAAAKSLSLALAGYGPIGKDLYARLELPLPEKATKKPAATKGRAA